MASKALAGISYVYIYGALLTTWNIVFNLIYHIDLIATAQSISLYQIAINTTTTQSLLTLHVTLIPTEDLSPSTAIEEEHAASISSIVISTRDFKFNTVFGAGSKRRNKTGDESCSVIVK